MSLALRPITSVPLMASGPITSSGLNGIAPLVRALGYSIVKGKERESLRTMVTSYPETSIERLPAEHRETLQIVAAGNHANTDAVKKALSALLELKETDRTTTLLSQNKRPPGVRSITLPQAIVHAAPQQGMTRLEQRRGLLARLLRWRHPQIGDRTAEMMIQDLKTLSSTEQISEYFKSLKDSLDAPLSPSQRRLLKRIANDKTLSLWARVEVLHIIIDDAGLKHRDLKKLLLARGVRRIIKELAKYPDPAIYLRTFELFEDFIDHWINASIIVNELQIKIFKSALQINNREPHLQRTQVINLMRDKYNLRRLKTRMLSRKRADPDSETQDIPVWAELETGLIRYIYRSKPTTPDRNVVGSLTFTIDMSADSDQHKIIEMRPIPTYWRKRNTQHLFGALLGKSASPKIPVSAEDWPEPFV